MNREKPTNELLDAYYNYLQIEEKSEHTIEKYMRDARTFIDFADGRAITKELVIDYKNTLIEKNYAVSSINSMLSSYDDNAIEFVYFTEADDALSRYTDWAVVDAGLVGTKTYYADNNKTFLADSCTITLNENATAGIDLTINGAHTVTVDASASGASYTGSVVLKDVAAKFVEKYGENEEYADANVTKGSNIGADKAVAIDKAKLTMEDSTNEPGRVVLNSTTVGDWPTPNVATNVFTNQGTLVINGGYYENVGQGHCAYVVDNNSNTGNVSLTVNGGKLVAQYCPIRTFLNSSTKTNDVVLNGGEFTGNYIAYIQQPSSKYQSSPVDFQVKGGTYNCVKTYRGPVKAFYIDALNDAEIKLSISGGKFANTDNTKDWVYIETSITPNANVIVSAGIFSSDKINADYIPIGKAVVDNTDPETKDVYPYTIGIAPVAPAVDEHATTESTATVPQTAETGLAEKVVEEVIKEITKNKSVSGEGATNIQSETVQDALKTEIEKTDGVSMVDSTSQLKITVKSVAATTTETTVNKITAKTVTTTSAKYDVKPWVTIETTNEQGVTTTETRMITNEELAAANAKDPNFAIDFYLAVPESMKGEAVQVKHYNNDDGTGTPDWVRVYPVEGSGTNRYVALSEIQFSVYEIDDVQTENYVAVNVEQKEAYKKLSDALDAAAASATSLEEPQTVVLVNDSSEANVYQVVGAGVTLDLQGHNITAMGVAVFGKMIDSKGVEDRKIGEIHVAIDRLAYCVDGNMITIDGAGDAKYLPAWKKTEENAGYYTLCKVDHFYSKWQNVDANRCKYGFTPLGATGNDEDKADIKRILDSNSHVKMMIIVEFTNKNNIKATQQYVVGEKLISQLYDNAGTHCIVLNMNGNPKSDNYNRVISLNHSGRFLWEKLEMGCRREELADALIEHFHIDRTTAENDAERFVCKLNELGYIDDEE